MPISSTSPDHAPDVVKEVCKDFSSKMHFPSPPNFILTQGHSPTVVKGSWECRPNVLVTGKVDRWIKEMLFVAISKDRNCHYCAAAHIACCRTLGVQSSLLDFLLRDVNFPIPGCAT